MDWGDEGIFLSAKPLGEANIVAEIFSRAHGRHLGLVRGGRSRRMRPLLQPGNLLRATWRARLSEHLGGFNVELMEAHAALVLDDAAALAAISSLTGLARLLAELGFGLDLSECAATGIDADLANVSPRSGRAVSRDAGKPYCDRLLNLP